MSRLNTPSPVSLVPVIFDTFVIFVSARRPGSGSPQPNKNLQLWPCSICCTHANALCSPEFCPHLRCADAFRPPALLLVCPFPVSIGFFLSHRVEFLFVLGGSCVVSTKLKMQLVSDSLEPLGAASFHLFKAHCPLTFLSKSHCHVLNRAASMPKCVTQMGWGGEMDRKWTKYDSVKYEGNKIKIEI